MKRNRPNPRRERKRRRHANNAMTRKELLAGEGGKVRMRIVTPKRTITKAYISTGGLTP